MKSLSKIFKIFCVNWVAVFFTPSIIENRKNIWLGLPNWIYFSEYKNTRLIIDKWTRTPFFKIPIINKTFLSIFGLLYWVMIHFCIEIQNKNIGLFKEFNLLFKKCHSYYSYCIRENITTFTLFFLGLFPLQKVWASELKVVT